MSLQAFLARLYVDARFRDEFFASPIVVAQRVGLPVDEARAVQSMDRAEVELAAASFESKRAGR